jgi:hypothetical protein
MTTVVVASSFLSASLLSMLVPLATVVAMLTWGVLLIRRHERRRQSVETGDRSAAGAGATEGSRPGGQV